MTVGAVVDECWAFRMGVRAGDSMLAVNGWPIGRLTVDAFKLQLGGTHLRFLIQQEAPGERALHVPSDIWDLGLKLRPALGLVSIVEVYDGFWAERAGLRPGWRISAVGGRSVRGVGDAEFQRLLQARPLVLHVLPPLEQEDRSHGASDELRSFLVDILEQTSLQAARTELAALADAASHSLRLLRDLGRLLRETPMVGKVEVLLARLAVPELASVMKAFPPGSRLQADAVDEGKRVAAALERWRVTKTQGAEALGRALAKDFEGMRAAHRAAADFGLMARSLRAGAEDAGSARFERLEHPFARAHREERRRLQAELAAQEAQLARLRAESDAAAVAAETAAAEAQRAALAGRVAERRSAARGVAAAIRRHREVPAEVRRVLAVARPLAEALARAGQQELSKQVVAARRRLDVAGLVEALGSGLRAARDAQQAAAEALQAISGDCLRVDREEKIARRARFAEPRVRQAQEREARALEAALERTARRDGSDEAWRKEARRRLGTALRDDEWAKYQDDAFHEQWRQEQAALDRSCEMADALLREDIGEFEAATFRRSGLVEARAELREERAVAQEVQTEMVDVASRFVYAQDWRLRKLAEISRWHDLGDARRVYTQLQAASDRLHPLQGAEDALLRRLDASRLAAGTLRTIVHSQVLREEASAAELEAALGGMGLMAPTASMDDSDLLEVVRELLTSKSAEAAEATHRLGAVMAAMARAATG